MIASLARLAVSQPALAIELPKHIFGQALNNVVQQAANKAQWTAEAGVMFNTDWRAVLKEANAIR